MNLSIAHLSSYVGKEHQYFLSAHTQPVRQQD